MNQPPVVYDLTEVIRGMKRGRRRDVKLLCEHLEKGIFFIPLAESLSQAVEGIRISENQVICPHLIIHGDGSTYAVLFTREGFLTPFESEQNWKTGGGALQFARLPGRMALAVILQLMEKGTVLGLLINPYHETSLQLSPLEVDYIFHGESVPLLDYVYSTPPGPDEQIQLRDYEAPLPAELIEAIGQFFAAHQELSSYDIIESYNADRDMEPCLALNLHTHQSGTNFQKIAEDLIAKVQGLVPPPGYLRIFFNEQILKT